MKLKKLEEKIIFNNFDWSNEDNYKNIKFDLNIIIEYKDQIYFVHLFKYQKFSDEELDELVKYINPMIMILSNNNINEDFIEKHWEKIDLTNFFNKFSRNILSEKFIIRHLDDILNNIRVFFDFINYNKLSENLIEIILKKYDYKVPGEVLFWNTISCQSNLSENFIKKYKDKVNWHKILDYQDVSIKFVKRMKKYIDKKDYDYFMLIMKDN